MYELLELYENLSNYPVTAAPLLKELYQHFTPQYATQWRVIGTLLGLTGERLNIIEYDHMFKAEPCCNAMLEKWLQVDTTASWKKLFTVIESSSMFTIPHKGDKICIHIITCILYYH